LFLVVLATAHRELVWLGIVFLGVLVAGLRAARLPVGAALARAGVVLPFTAMFAGVSWLAGDPGRGAALVMKAYLSALAVLLVVSTTPVPLLLRGMEMTGAPRFLLTGGERGAFSGGGGSSGGSVRTILRPRGRDPSSYAVTRIPRLLSATK
jgi:uncharacterized membrane protein YgcG